MNQIMECKDMNREEAMELCRQEYEKRENMQRPESWFGMGSLALP